MPFDPRRIAVVFCAFGAFLNLYAPQAVLPLIAQEFGVGAAAASLIITASTLAVAATAPFTGAVADVLGRKRVIVAAMALLLIPGVMLPLSTSLNEVIFWRFVQGLLLPPIFAVTIAYIGDEWPPQRATGVIASYTSASSVGGFLGRFIPGMLIAYVGWRGGFFALAVLLAICLLGGRSAVAARTPVRARQQSDGVAAADDGASAQPAAARGLRGRLRRAVQLHRRLHLHELPSRRRRRSSFRRPSSARCSWCISPARRRRR